MEAFARILWGLAPLRAGGGGKDVDWSFLRELLLAGVREGGWGPMKDYDQRIVETPVIMLALLFARDVMWDPLTAAEKDDVTAWVEKINAVRFVENNWLWFRVITNAVLRLLGRKCDKDRESADLRLLNGMWCEASGYSDGACENRDYYISMAMHFYGLIYARMIEQDNPMFAETLRMRARQHAPDYLRLFAVSGAATPYGRSLHYRFAQGAMLAAAAFDGRTGLPWEILRSVLSRHLRYWLRKPIFTDRGLLSCGYGYNQPSLIEGYASSASPYWALKSLLVLALPEEHPFWQAGESQMSNLSPVSLTGDKRFLITRPNGGADVVLLAASGSQRDWIRHHQAKYQKFAYSAEFGFSISLGNATLELFAPDSCLAISEDNRNWRTRDSSKSVFVDGNALVSIWTPWPDVIIETRVEPDMLNGGHIREHRIRTGRYIHIFEGGFCVPHEPDSPSSPIVIKTSVTLASGSYVSKISDLDGQRRGVVVATEPNTHILWPLALLPGLLEELKPGTHIRRCMVAGEVTTH